MVKPLLILVLPLAVACGRSGFDELAAPDATAPLDAAQPPALACDGARFPTGPTTSSLGATPTDDGYFVLAVDSGGGVSGAAFDFSADRSLAQTTGQVAIATGATGSVAGVGLPEGALVEVPYGRPDTTGTVLVPLDRTLQPRGAQAKHDTWIAGAAMLARTSSGAIALAGQDRTNRNIQGQLVDGTGAFLGAPVLLVAGSTSPQTATLVAAGDHFLATWVASGKDDAEARAQLLDDKLVPITAVTKVSSDPVNGAEFPRAAYAPVADRYLFAWFQKVNGGMDQVWVSLRDGRLNELAPPQLVASDGTMPIVAAGTDDFLVVWKDDGAKLAAARVKMTGEITPIGVTNTGGKSAGWDVVVRDGQPALVWVESGGTGPNLWLNPLCN
ncbi:MAG TPA: hypothetical protein VGC42_09825 [Kofleriaceae bacterium]